MPGLELVGPIAGCVQVPSSDPTTESMESAGLFVAGDASVMRGFSGADLGWRWLCRAQGPLVKRVPGWPPGPSGPTHGYFPTEEQARSYYAALRQHALASTPGLQAQDTRAATPLNVPSGYAESFWQNGQEVLRLVYDRMRDLQVFLTNTNCIGIMDVAPGGPPVVSYSSQNQVLYLAIARGASGGAEHVVVVFSDQHQPNPTIPEGLPRAEWMRKFDKGGLHFPTNVLVVQWGRLSGAQTLAAEDAQNPAASLAHRLQAQPVVPLAAPGDVAPRLGNVPAAYAVRLEPGTYTTTYYELMDTPHGGFSCCAISREGAPSFMPAVLGNAGGIRHGGLSVEQYAMLSEERDAVIMREGPMSPSLGALCAKYGIPVSGNYGTSGRIHEWELMIQGDPSFSAQWVMHRGVARMRLQGIEPTPEQIQAMGQQQQVVSAALEQHGKRHEEKVAARRRAALHAIEFSAGRTWEDVLAELKRVAPEISASWILHESLDILRNPGEQGNPSFQQVDQRVEPLAKAHWHSMDADERRTEAATPEKHAKEKVQDIYPRNGLKAPGFFAWLSRLSD